MKKIMLSAVVAMLVSSMAAALPAWGCDAMGPDRHVGVVTGIDRDAGTFTIIDAQLQEPMTFQAGKKVLKDLELKRSYVITFKMQGKRMVAEDAEPAS